MPSRFGNPAPVAAHLSHCCQPPPPDMPAFETVPPTPPLSKSKAKVSARQLRKLQRAEELQEVLQTFAEQDIPLVYTDGSSAVEEGVGRLAGYGVCCADRDSVAVYVPSDMR